MTWGKDKAPRARGTFEEEWPDLARGLDRTLRARHVPSARREDIIQETALRLFVRWLELDPERPLWPFALTIAMNLLKDEHRMQARRNASPQPPDEFVGRGVEEEALARLELTNVQIALQKLTPAQRSVLLAEIGAAPYDDRGADALKMLRMRARRTLRNVIGRASVLLPFPIPRVRRLVNSLGVTSQRATGLDAGQGLALSTLGVAGAATILGASLGIGFAPGAAGPLPGGVAALAGSVSTGATEGAIHRVRPHGESAHRYASAARVSQGRSGGSHALGRSGHAPAPSAAQVDARGTGIDEDPSLESESYRVSIVAKAAAAGQGAVIEQEVEQGNPACGSPADPRDRPCVRPTKPRVRSEVQLAGQGAAVGSPR
jgi:DNA-directed RNA polymerase specialized sigma24 family protein